MATKSPEAFRTISEVADDLDLPQHVLRFWETRFTQIKPLKRGGGRRYYRPDDIELLRGIRTLLYGEGYTIRGVQRLLKEQGARFVTAAGRGEIGALPERGGQAAAEVETADDDLPPLDIAPDEHMVAVERDDQPDAEEDAEAVAGMARRLVARPEAAEPHPVRPAGLSRDDADRLRATLADLLECKRLLDQAR